MPEVRRDGVALPEVGAGFVLSEEGSDGTAWHFEFDCNLSVAVAARSELDGLENLLAILEASRPARIVL